MPHSIDMSDKTQDQVTKGTEPLEYGLSLGSALIWAAICATAASSSALLLGASIGTALLCHSLFGMLTLGLFASRSL